jgi:hypothetical protein
MGGLGKMRKHQWRGTAVNITKPQAVFFIVKPAIGLFEVFRG